MEEGGVNWEQERGGFRGRLFDSGKRENQRAMPETDGRHAPGAGGLMTSHDKT